MLGGRETVESKVYQYHPRTSMTEGNIRGIRRVMVSDIAFDGVEISYGIAQATISDDLGYRKHWQDGSLHFSLMNRNNSFSGVPMVVDPLSNRWDSFVQRIFTITSKSKQAAMK